MKKYITAVSKVCIRNLALIIGMMVVSLPDVILAQGDGPRFYWKGLNGTNAVPMIGSSMGGNANPFDPSYNVITEARFDATMMLAGYVRMLPVFKRSAMASILLPMGRISSGNTTARGYGDPMMQFGINVVGPKAIMNIPDMLRYKPGFSVDLIASLAVPVGEYDKTSTINIGQNRWYGRVGAPVVWQIGKWVPGKRTTVELLPAVWFFTDNNDFDGKTMSTEPMYQVEGHLTRDFAERLWGSLDVISMSGGQATIGGVEGTSLSNIGVGGTLGYHANDNMQLTLSYNSTVNDSNKEDLNMDGFRFSLIYGWHDLIEGMRRLKTNE